MTPGELQPEREKTPFTTKDMSETHPGYVCPSGLTAAGLLWTTSVGKVLDILGGDTVNNIQHIKWL